MAKASQHPELIEEIRRELQREVDGVTLDAYIQSHDAEAIASQGSGAIRHRPQRSTSHRARDLDKDL